MRKVSQELKKEYGIILKHSGIEYGILAQKIFELYDWMGFDVPEAISDWFGYNSIDMNILYLGIHSIDKELSVEDVYKPDCTGFQLNWRGLEIGAEKRTREPGHADHLMSYVSDPRMMFVVVLLVATSAALFVDSAIILAVIAALTAALITSCVIANRFGFFAEDLNQEQAIIRPYSRH